MMNFFSLIFFFCLTCSYAQTDWVKWGKGEISYSKKNDFTTRDYSISGENFPEAALKSLTSVYWYFISDVDGDNCPFRPSCSNFLIEAVKETNFPQGVLMFFDRFTRDLNIFQRNQKYPRYGLTYYYDPVSNYTLNENLIQYAPPNKIIRSE